MAVEVSVEDYNSWGRGVEEFKKTGNGTITENSRIEFSYDGGRVSVTVDGDEVYNSHTHSHDVSISINNSPY